MTDAPEFIWVSPSIVPEDRPDWSCGDWVESTMQAGSRDVQYVRADIAETEIERLRAKVAKLERLLPLDIR